MCASLLLACALEVATLAPFRRSASRRATVTEIRALGGATLAPFRRCAPRRATVTVIRALEVATLARFRRSAPRRATVTGMRASRSPRPHRVAAPGPAQQFLYIQTRDRLPQRLLLVMINNND